METLHPDFFSLIFLIICIISLVFGIYVISKNPREKLNRIFFVSCICLCIWSFGFSIAINAPDDETCLFWRRFSAIGWGSIYAVLLHFGVVLTENKRILKKIWIYPLLYLPAALIDSVYGLSEKTAQIQYQFVNNGQGWTNIAVNNGWDIFFYFYFSLTSLALLMILWHWKKTAKTVENRRQAKIIFTAFAIVIVLGSFTDLINNTFKLIHMPQLAPILFILLLSAISYCIRKYRLMNKRVVDETELILNESNRSKMYDLTTVVLIVCGIIYFVCQHILSKNERLLSSLGSGVFLILMGIVLNVCTRMKTKRNDMEAIYTLMASLVIPIFVVKLVGHSSSVIFALPFVTIIGSLVFNQRLMLASITVSTIITEIYVWISARSLHLTLKSDVYLSRLTILIVAVIFAFYVNRIYIHRLRQNAEQMRVQTIASEISSNFVTVNQINIGKKIAAMLKLVGQFFQVEYVSLRINKSEYAFNETRNRFCWYKKDSEQIVYGNDSFSAEWKKHFGINSIIHISDREKLPKEAKAIREELEERHIQSVLSVPISVQNVAIGRLTLESLESENGWNSGRMSLLELVTNILADALVKVNAEKRIHFMAYFDSLTKLPNRVLFNERTSLAMEYAKQHGNHVAIVFLDLDSFKDVNDTLGHEVGDLLIRQVSEQLTRCVKPADTVSRFGGDEFLILLDHLSDRAEATSIVEKIMALFESPFMLQDQEVFVTASAGIAFYSEDGETTEVLAKNADTAMYAAKSKGKNQYAICTEAMKEKLQMKMRLMSSLFYALNRNELVVQYQPQVSVQTERVIGLEALLRWNHTELGVISPAVFIGLAEQTGLINQIGEWVLKTACMQLKKWMDQGLPAVRMAVNLSVVQLRNPLLVKQIKRVLHETGINPILLELEVTESAAARDFDYIVQVLNQLKELGVSISIDDFGTKYSSLGRLKRLPIDRLKMDMQFVQDIDQSVKGTGITKAIINLAKNLNLKLIAEGVENQEQLEFLKKWDCDEIQGYYYYRPMVATDVEKILTP
ncbi:EAL domain-containing protein [Sporolactobacillus sp. STCC-11]|uniref:EAL domain-containing protein n=1 Tax=Sporolactobacillus caesalpiniae TaxID=3230362 RepID=UPI003394B9F2